LEARNAATSDTPNFLNLAPKLCIAANFSTAVNPGANFDFALRNQPGVTSYSWSPNFEMRGLGDLFTAPGTCALNRIADLAISFILGWCSAVAGVILPEKPAILWFSEMNCKTSFVILALGFVSVLHSPTRRSPAEFAQASSLSDARRFVPGSI
jgi:hypothetical protein